MTSFTIPRGIHLITDFKPKQRVYLKYAKRGRPTKKMQRAKAVAEEIINSAGFQERFIAEMKHRLLYGDTVRYKL